MADKKREVKGWITRNGVHIPIYGDYTAQPKAPKIKSAKGMKVKKTPFKLKHDVWHEDKEGWSVGLTSQGDIYVGSNPLTAEYFKNTEENKARALDYWKANSQSREIKLLHRHDNTPKEWYFNKEAGEFGRWETRPKEKRRKKK